MSADRTLRKNIATGVALAWLCNVAGMFVGWAVGVDSWLSAGVAVCGMGIGAVLATVTVIATVERAETSSDREVRP